MSEYWLVITLVVNVLFAFTNVGGDFGDVMFFIVCFLCVWIWPMCWA